MLPLIANVLEEEPDEYVALLKMFLANGDSFPKARSNALKEYIGNTKGISENEIEITIKSPNNILAIEYMKAIKHFDSKLKPLAIKRVGSDYASLDTTDDFVSATAIRNQMKQGNDIKSLVPPDAYMHYEDAKPIFMSDFDLLLGDALIKSNDFSEIYGVNKDLSNRIKNQKNNYTDIKNFLMQIDSKNNTKTGISRALLHTILNIQKEDVRRALENNYFTSARLLGINRGSNLISVINDNSKIPLIGKFTTHYENSTGIDRKLLDIQLYADEIYRLVYMTKYKEIIPNEFERQIVVK